MKWHLLLIGLPFSALGAGTEPLSNPLDSRMSVVFKPFVFTGDALPKCEFERPAEAKEALGACEIATRYYSGDFQPVKTAAKPGRYGAIVEIRAAGGLVAKRYFTLYKEPQGVDWKQDLPALSTLGLPEGFGLDPAVVKENSALTTGFYLDAIRQAFERDDRGAEMLAALSETKPGSRRAANPGLRWKGAVTAAWWDQLRARTGDLQQYKYLSWLPAGYEAKDPAKRWPLIIFLHGSGERGVNLEDLRKNGLPLRMRGGNDLPAIVIAPQCAPEDWWMTTSLNRMLDEVMKKYRVDASRVYLTGLSMGGYGTWAWAEANPERFAALAPVCGGGDANGVEQLTGLPIWAFHGAKDPLVPAVESKSMVDAINALHGNARLTLYPEAGHDSWTQAYAEPELYRWMLAQQRSPK